MGKRYSFYLRMALLFSDFILITAACFITLILMKFLHPGFRFSQKHMLELFSFLTAWLVASIIMQLYSSETIEKIERLLRQTIRTALLQSVIFFMFMFFAKDKTVLKFLLICYSMLVFFFGVSRFFVMYLSDLFLKKTFLKKSIAIVGYNEMGRKLADFFSTSRSDYVLKSFFDEDVSDMAITPKGEIINPIAQCIEYAAKNNIEEVYSTILPGNREVIQELVEVAEQKCIRLRFVPDLSQNNDGHFNIDYVGEFPVITLHKEPLEEISNRLKKRLMDVVFSFLVTTLLLSWLIPIVGLLIKLETKGPVFYIQNRPGRNNHMFKIIKFRTMVVNEDDDQFVQVKKNDPRITKVGKFLRKTSLDEMPQFLNVLTGEMSVIGPRPHPIKLNETFMDSIHSYMARHFIKPGISGWAQVNGCRGETNTSEDMQKRIEHDLWYLENWSLMLDVRIFFMTVINVLRGDKNAY